MRNAQEEHSYFASTKGAVCVSGLPVNKNPASEHVVTPNYTSFGVTFEGATFASHTTHRTLYMEGIEGLRSLPDTRYYRLSRTVHSA